MNQRRRARIRKQRQRRKRQKARRVAKRILKGNVETYEMKWAASHGLRDYWADTERLRLDTYSQ